MVASSLRRNRVILAGLIAISCVLAPPRDSFADWQNPVGVCKDSRGCGSDSGSGGGSISSSGGGSIPWGRMTSRGLEKIKNCGDPLCWMIQGPIAITIGAICDGPYYAVKGVGYGLYYGGRGLGQGLAYTGRAIGRGLAYPFNRPPKLDLPPTTWEQYKHDVLRHQKRLAKANKDNKENQRWCVKNVPLEISPNRARWEGLCNPADAVSRAALPPTLSFAVIPEPPPSTGASPPGTQTKYSITPAIPVLQEPGNAAISRDAQAKMASAGGFDNSQPISGKQFPVLDAPPHVSADAQPEPMPPAAVKPEATAASLPPENAAVSAKSTPEVDRTPESPTPAASTIPPSDTKFTPLPAPPEAASAATTPTSTGVAVPKTAPSPTVLSSVTATITAATAVPAVAAFVLPKFVEIKGDKTFNLKTARDLEIISRTKIGKALLKSMADSGRKLTIVSDRGAGNETVSHPLNWADAWRIKKMLPGVGTKTDVTIKYDPDRTNVVFLGSPYSDRDVTWTREPNRPSHVGMFHEMVHADDMMHGTIDPTTAKNVGKRGGDSISAFELRAVGLDGEKHAFDENSYRRELSLPERDFY